MKYSIGNLNSIQRKQVVDLDDQIESHNCQSLNNNKTGGTFSIYISELFSVNITRFLSTLYI